MNNSLFTGVELTLLPIPEVIEKVDFEVLLQEVLAQFRTILPEYELLLESDPVVKVIEAFCYREMILRERINDVAKRRLLAFAQGSDLDHLAAFYQIQRMTVSIATDSAPAVMETDDAFKYRIQQRILGWSNAGGAAHYRYYALSADPRVREVAVYSPDFSNVFRIGGGKVQIAVLSTVGNLVPTPDLLTIVSEVVGRYDVKMLTDLVEVIPAVSVHLSVVAKISLLPGVPLSMVGVLKLRVESEFLKIQGLGRDVTLSWLTGVLQQEGVYSVQILQPVANLVIKPNYFPILDEVIVLLAGYSDSEGYGAGETDAERAQRIANSIYVDFAVANRRTQAEILSDLEEIPTLGVVAPTLQGIAVFLNLSNIYDAGGEFLPKDQLAYLIWLKLGERYATGTANSY